MLSKTNKFIKIVRIFKLSLIKKNKLTIFDVKISIFRDYLAHKVNKYKVSERRDCSSLISH